MLSKIKYFLWKIGFYPDVCPYDGSKLLQHGYEPYYTCPIPSCRFNKKPVGTAIK